VCAANNRPCAPAHGDLALVAPGVHRCASVWCTPQHVAMGGPQVGLSCSALDFSDSLRFQDWISSKFNRPINLLPGNFDRHEFFLVVSFGRCSLRLCLESMDFFFNLSLVAMRIYSGSRNFRIRSSVFCFLARTLVSQFIGYSLTPAPCSKRIYTFGILADQTGSLNGSIIQRKN
jgi:hypothetical protein